ncbi:energy transducer TonB [Geothermobacter ehrlichii]|uniref:energy transducer TonB n=1 Tax=Geothermobacter ehrlichii TaxID=213224 RepID=UPI0016530761|nr:energy transducer TonB [Geothermobacter ehrlichii]
MAAAGDAGGRTGLQTDAQPALLANPRPVYPSLARRRGWEGTVLVRIRVETSGRVGEASLVHSSGHRILDRSALKQVRGWRFRPAMKDGKPVAGEVILPIRFELHQG